MSVSRLWYINADFELELESPAYRRTPTIAARNRRLAVGALWFASPGDALLLEPPWEAPLAEAAAASDLVLVDPDEPIHERARLFTPWGWSAHAVAVGSAVGATVDPPPLEAVARVNSKVFSHELELELGVAVPGAGLARSLVELNELAATACPGPADKWVVKSPFGFTARGRVLGRGPRVDPASATWAERRFARGETLLFEPWLDVLREYGVQIHVGRDARIEVLGVTDIQTNGAGAVTGYLFGRPPSPERMRDLEAIGLEVGARLALEGYWGPANVDSLEHAGGLRPLLEINARYTLGFVALAVERSLRPSEPTPWRLEEGAFALKAEGSAKPPE